MEVYETRKTTDDYHEVVIFNKDINQWLIVCHRYLGTVTKPAGAKPTKEDLNLTKAFGGLSNGQTLFKKEEADSYLIAMYWPWTNGVHTTFKLIVLKK